MFTPSGNKFPLVWTVSSQRVCYAVKAPNWAMMGFHVFTLSGKLTTQTNHDKRVTIRNNLSKLYILKRILSEINHSR